MFTLFKLDQKDLMTRRLLLCVSWEEIDCVVLLTMYTHHYEALNNTAALLKAVVSLSLIIQIDTECLSRQDVPQRSSASVAIM